jgi:hypothetical protein
MIGQSGRLLSPLGGGLPADTLGIRAIYLLGGLLPLTAAAVGSHAARTAPARSRAISPGQPGGLAGLLVRE